MKRSQYKMSRSVTALASFPSPVAFTFGIFYFLDPCRYHITWKLQRSWTLVICRCQNYTFKCIYHQHHISRKMSRFNEDCFDWIHSTTFYFSRKVGDNCHDATINSEIRWSFGPLLSVDGSALVVFLSLLCSPHQKQLDSMTKVLLGVEELSDMIQYINAILSFCRRRELSPCEG